MEASSKKVRWALDVDPLEFWLGTQLARSSNYKTIYAAKAGRWGLAHWKHRPPMSLTFALSGRAPAMPMSVPWMKPRCRPALFMWSEAGMVASMPSITQKLTG